VEVKVYDQISWVWITSQASAAAAGTEPLTGRVASDASRILNSRRGLAIYGRAAAHGGGVEGQWVSAMLFVSGTMALPVHVHAASLLPLLKDPRLLCVGHDPLLAGAETSDGSGGLTLPRGRAGQMRLSDESPATMPLREEFLSVVSHELRSPLAAVRNAAALLCSPMTETPTRQWAQALLERQVRRMTRLVDDLLDLSRRTHGRLVLRCERLDLRVAVNNAIETLEPEMRQRRHRLTVDLPDAAVWLQGDAGRLEQVFVNLLANACKFTDTGGELSVRMHVSGAQVRVQIRDSGIGIESDALPHIFEPFKQADEAARLPGAGLGIGLALVREFVELHGGNVTVSSAGAGQGSEFTVHLRMEAVPIALGCGSAIEAEPPGNVRSGAG
jgi:signal transduction histidine kinase